MNKIISISFLLISSFGCSNNSKNIDNTDDFVNDSLRAVIDSIRLSNSKNSSIGKHTHPSIATIAKKNPLKINQSSTPRKSIGDIDKLNQERRERMKKLGIMVDDENKNIN